MELGYGKGFGEDICPIEECVDFVDSDAS